MDAVKFIKEYQRMCAKESCHNCPAFGNNVLGDCDLYTKDPEMLVEIVEQWSQSHPQKTIMQDFLQKYPNAPIFDGIPEECVADLGFSVPSYCSCEIEQEGFCKKCWNRLLEE